MLLQFFLRTALPKASGLLGALFLTLIFLGAGNPSSSHAQNNGEADKQKYLLELAKYWSFGYENYKNKQYSDAIKHFWRVAKLDTIDKFDKVYRYLGDSYYKNGNLDSAQYCFELGIEKYPDNVYLHRMVGFFLTQRNQVDEAIKEYETIVELEPESAEDLMRLASLYVKAERIEDAIETYDKVLALDPDNLEAQNNKTALIASTGDVEAVIAEKEKVRAKDTGNSQVRFELGTMYFNQGQYEQSIELFNEFLQLSPNDVQAMTNVAISHQRLERYQDAVTEFKKIIEIDPSNKAIVAEVARCYNEMNQFATARTYANKVVAIDKQSGLGWLVLGEVYETCADKCVEQKDGKVEYDDKLVYELADSNYRKALSDPRYKVEAERHHNFVKAVLPTTEDKFMNKSQTKAQGACYSWIY